MVFVTTTPRVRAPELRGRGWLNTAGPLTLRELRGRFVLLDFWTFCCINCLHVLDELRPVEEAFADELVVIGAHSPKDRTSTRLNSSHQSAYRMPASSSKQKKKM